MSWQPLDSGVPLKRMSSMTSHSPSSSSNLKGIQFSTGYGSTLARSSSREGKEKMKIELEGETLDSLDNMHTDNREVHRSHFTLIIFDVRKSEVMCTLLVRWWDKISDIKVMLRKITKESLSRHHLYLPKSGKELSNNLLLQGSVLFC